MQTRCSYWTLLILDASGRGYQPRLLADAQTTVNQLCPTGVLNELPDEKLQAMLYQQLQSGEPSAGLSLRCCISEYVVLACRILLKKFDGYRLNFSELLSCVLDDTGIDRKASYQSTGEHILATFTPESGPLRNWAIRLVKQHPGVALHLKENGILLLSNWGLLNDTKPSRLRHILTEFHPLSESEIESFCAVLTAYRSIYLADRLTDQLNGSRCLPPSGEQLQRMATLLADQNDALGSEVILAKLHQIAQWLRAKRLHQTGPSEAPASLDIAETRDRIEVQVRPNEAVASGADRFLATYQTAFKAALRTAITRAIDQRLTHHKAPQKQQQYLQAMTLSHCQKLTMTEIASRVGLEKQYQVSRLLQLKRLRSNISALMLHQLKQDVPELAAAYADPEQLISLEQQIQAILEEQISEVMQEADRIMHVQKSLMVKNQLSQAICYCLAQTAAYPPGP